MYITLFPFAESDVPQKVDQLIIPPFPKSEPARSFAVEDVGKIESDMIAAQNAPDPARTLSWSVHDRDIQSIVSDYNN